MIIRLEVTERVYVHKLTGEFLVSHNGVCPLFYELLGEL